MQPESSVRPLRDYLRVLRRRRVLVLAAVLIAGFTALVFSVLKSPTYVATATVSFSDQSKDLNTAGIPAIQNPTPDKFAAAEANAVRRPKVVSRVREALGLEEPTADLRSAVSTTVDPASNLVDISVSSSSSRLAARLANEFARQTQIALARRQRAQYGRAARRLNAKLRNLPPGSAVTEAYEAAVARLVTLSAVARPVEIQQPAETPAAPASPRPVLYTIVGTLLGLLAGCAAAILLEALDRRLTDPSEAERQLDLPLVGYVPATALGKFVTGTNGAGPAGEDFEAFRILRFNSNFIGPVEQHKALVITSPLAEEGKTTVATGLAVANAVAEKRTLLVEADLRRPVLAERLRIESAPGLTDYLAGEARAEEIPQIVDVGALGWSELRPAALEQEDGSPGAVGPDPRLVCITAGHTTNRPAELLGSTRFADFIQAVSANYDSVIIDSAPLLPVGDTLELLTSVDGILVCLRLEQTTREQASAARAALDRLPPIPAGLVITGLQRSRDEGYYGHEYAASSAVRS